MKKLSIITLTIIMALMGACKSEKTDKAATPAIDVSLTDAEKAGGVLTPEILWKYGRLGRMTLSPDGSTVLFQVTNYDLPTEARATNIWSVPAAGGDPVQLTAEGGAGPEWIENGAKIAYIAGGKIMVMNPDGSAKKEITGLEEYEILSFSPAGDKVYFTRRVKLDQTANEKYGLPNAKVRIIDDLMYRHWDYWHDYSYSHIFTASFDGSTISNEKDIMEGQRFDAPDAPWFDEADITWSPDGKYIAYACKKLTGKAYSLSTNTDIYLYNVATGEERNITEGNMGYDKAPVFSPDGSMIAYTSMEEDGYESDLERLFVYNIAMSERKWVSEGWDYNVGNIQWNGTGEIWFTSPYRGTQPIFKISLASGSITSVTQGDYDMGPLQLKNNILIAGIQSMARPTEVAKVDMSNGQFSMITDVNGHIYESIKMGKSEERYIKTQDGKDLQMWIIYPPDFDPSKKYPALLYCKGGPQGPLGQSWSYRWNYQMMAANGYIVVAVNRRGNSGFGSYWREQISGDYGGRNMQDYLDGIDAMAKEPFVDKDRLGAVGASYGGYSVFYLAGMHNKRFKAFVSHCGVYNTIAEYGSTEEYWYPNKDYQGAPWDKPQPPGYNKFSPHTMVDRWDTPILIITGANDFRIPYSQSFEAFNSATLRGVPARLLFFENESHWVTKPQNAVIWQKEYFEFLDTYLK
ncbi:MAG: S9 family peptidase [Bacteroidales bacterium]|jgi:dipeptidyl aminopeptidase/acylaminoacyl peptidase|nr:S9 family peptidase [Bacteroidales bacterium]